MLGGGAFIAVLFLAYCLYALVVTLPRLDQIFANAHSVSPANALGLVHALRALFKAFALFTGATAGFCGVMIFLLRKHFTRL